MLLHKFHLTTHIVGTYLPLTFSDLTEETAKSRMIDFRVQEVNSVIVGGEDVSNFHDCFLFRNLTIART